MIRDSKLGSGKLELREDEFAAKFKKQLAISLLQNPIEGLNTPCCKLQIKDLQHLYSIANGPLFLMLLGPSSAGDFAFSTCFGLRLNIIFGFEKD
ncbi:hypothetical protein QQP08_007444 [Theobroma cacao]|nr:hypothetical protein QQP08_007444 [Theobroma cacao]